MRMCQEAMARGRAAAPLLLLLALCAAPGAALSLEGSRPARLPRVYPMPTTPCVLNVPGAAAEGSCKWISHSLCTGSTTSISGLSKGYASCLSRKKTCALVGSSDHLLNATFGEEIDAHEVVIRMNGAPAGLGPDAAYAPNVGTKTDVRFVNAHGRTPEAEKAQPRCIFLHEPYTPSCGRVCWRQPSTCRTDCNLTQLECRGHNEKKAQDWGQNYVFLDQVHPDMAQHMVDRATAGFKALAYALHNCDHISVYGFGPSCSGAVGMKYYNPLHMPYKWHNYDGELELMRGASGDTPQRLMPEGLKPWAVAQNLVLHLPACFKNQTAGEKLFRMLQGISASLRLSTRFL